MLTSGAMKSGRGLVGRRVMVAQWPTPPTRVYKITAVRQSGGNGRLFRLSSSTLRYHCYKQVKLVPLGRLQLEKLSPEVRADMIERLINPPVVHYSSPWFPKSALRFCRQSA